MGIIKATKTSIKGELSEQWLEVFSSGSIESGVLAKPAQRLTNSNSSNNHGSEHIISDGSTIIVNEGECAIATENGTVIGVYSEPAEHKFTSKNSRGFFGSGNLKSFSKSVWDRIGYGGDVHIFQNIYYINTKEILGMPFETARSFPLRIVDEKLNMDLDVSAVCAGLYSIKITDPEKFFTKVARRESGYVTKGMLNNHFEQELISVLQTITTQHFKDGGRPSDLPGLIPEIGEEVSKQISEMWNELRGISVISTSFSTLNLEAKDRAMITDLQREAMLQNPILAAAALARSEADSMTLAAKNKAGAAITSSMIFEEAYNKKTLWRCPECGNMNKSNFCESCGTKKP